MKNEKKSSPMKPFVIAMVVIFVGMFALALLGIFAAIAVPAFIRYSKKTKVVEAQMMVRKIENAVQVYYLKECKFPGNAMSSAIPTNGKKIIPKFNEGGFKQIGMPISKSVYFRYRLENAEGKLNIIADANFDVHNMDNHTHTLVLEKDKKCSLKSNPAVTTHELN